jgi:hypothetical protein
MTNPHIETLVNFLRDFADANADSFDPEQIEYLKQSSHAIVILDKAVDDLVKERDEAYEQLDRYKNGYEGGCHACEVVAVRNQELLKERDSARWEVCELSGNGSIDSAMRVAEERGWNVTEEDSDAEESH